MAHPEQKPFVAKVKDRFSPLFAWRRVLAVGSRDFNGTVRAPDVSLTTYTWNAAQHRVQKETETDVTNFLWDGENVIEEYDDALATQAEYTVATPAIALLPSENSMLPAPQPQPYGNLISQRRDGESSFYHFDALGSAQALTDSTQTVTDEYAYEAFGKVSSSTGTTDNPFTWVGQTGYYADEESGLYSLRRRGYDPTRGRFLTEDPMGFEAGDSNLYRYVGNNAPTKTDPSGLSGLSKLGKVIVKGFREAAETAIKNGVKREFRENFYEYMSRYLSKEVRDITQLHHVVCQQLFDNAAQISHFLDEVGVLKNSIENIVILPTRKALAKGVDIGTIALHEGGHLHEYYQLVANGLNDANKLYKAAVKKAGKNSAALEAAREAARVEVRKLQKVLKEGLLSGKVKLQKYDTAEARRNVIIGMMALFIASGMSPDEAEAAVMEVVEREVENETYYRQKNLLIRYGTAQYYTSESDSKLARWATFAVDFFNPVEDVQFATDLIEDTAVPIAKGLADLPKELGDVVQGSARDVAEAVQTIKTDPNAKWTLERGAILREALEGP